MAQEPFVRIPAPEGEQRSQRRKREERETDVWIRQVHAIGTPELGSMWVHVGDRGADMFPFFHACQETQTHFLVRAAQNRRVEGCEDEISYSLTQARAIPSQASRPNASSCQAWSPSAFDPVAACLWADDALAAPRTRHARARSL